MFTLEEIKTAHAQVESGKDFPKYIQDISQLGVTRYETYVTDGHTLFYGKDDYTLQSQPKYAALSIAEKSDSHQLQKDLKEHQMGKTNFLTFCDLSASSGVEKWVVDIAKMTCAYYDKYGKIMVTETIPQLSA